MPDGQRLFLHESTNVDGKMKLITFDLDTRKPGTNARGVVILSWATAGELGGA